ncbi:MAG: tetratricopeptide repeat protein, partial [Ekhidna sp.]|nr:tetratricopeptide repeat protein [Ekhidna sp.]
DSYHNLTSHYNAYFIAKEKVKEIERTIFDQQEWNYDEVLPIFPPFDTATSTLLKTAIEDCIQKASIAIQRHPDSKWEDDSYILVGKARHYNSEFPDAVETFKYVNTHSENDNIRHYALTELIRTFTEFEEYNNAVAVTDYLEKEQLNRDNRRRLYLNTAYLYQKRGDQDKMVKNLVKAEELYHSSDRARINFIIGQSYDELNFKHEAYQYYRNVLRSRPNYELEFYAKLYMARVTELAEANNLRKTRRYLKKLLSDSKNKEYQDKIYFEIAGFELNNGNIEKAINNYKLSIKNSSGNTRQKAYSYLRLGEIYYDSLKNYNMAKSYYDSAVSTMPQDEEIYETIKERQEILVDFVKQILTIHKNDSLLALSEIPQDSVLRLARSIIEKEKKEKKEKAKKEKQAAIVRSRSIAKQRGDNLITTASSGSVWYFNNPNQISRGTNDFLKQWGDRPLEDDWRRSSHAKFTTSTNQGIATNKVSEKTDAVEEISVDAEAERMAANVPKTDEEKALLLKEIEEALYNLGNIYHLRLEEDNNAIISFEELLTRFPKTEYRPEVMYQLFLLFKKSDPAASSRYGQMLKKEFPDTVYAKLVENSNYREDSFAANEQLKKLYKKLYTHYKNGNYTPVKNAIDSALLVHPENEFSDNLALLNVLATGHPNNERKYQYELGEFIKAYPQSDVLEYAKSLVKASEDFQQKRYNSGKAKYVAVFNQKHFFVIVYQNSGSLSEDIPQEITQYLQSKNLKNLKTGNLILSNTKSMVFVDSYPGRGTAYNFFKSFREEVTLKDKFKEEKFDIFVITEDNFDILYKTKDVDSYQNFFRKNYQ